MSRVIRVDQDVYSELMKLRGYKDKNFSEPIRRLLNAGVHDGGPGLTARSGSVGATRPLSRVARTPALSSLQGSPDSGDSGRGVSHAPHVAPRPQ